MTDDLTVTPFSTHWGTYFAEVRDGKMVGVRDWEGDPDPADIGPGIVDMVEHPTRVRRPAVRKSFLDKRSGSDTTLRGQEPFVELPWDEALDLAGDELNRVRTEHGNEAIFGGSYGWASAGRFHHATSQIHRFLNCVGGYVASSENYSNASWKRLLPHIVGPFDPLILDKATSWPVIAEHTELLVMFGGLPRKNAQVTSGGVGKHVLRDALIAAKRNGCEFVSVSPLKSDTIPEIEAEWLSPRPNSDAAMMLALAHTLYTEGLHDEAFLARYCTGFERFVPYLTGEADGQPKDADWAAAICTVEAETIRALARRMAGKRTFINAAWALQRADHGEQIGWLVVTLAAMLGQIGLPGGGFGLGYGSENGIGVSTPLLKYPALPQGRNAVAKSIPVARISDMLLNPGGEYQFDGETRTYADIRLVYWAGGNPFHHHQDINRFVRALHKPETIIVNEIWWTPMARHADIVFPATTVLEREDISMTHWERLMVAMRKAIEPVGEARSDYEIFTGVARRMGLESVFTEDRDAEDWLNHLWDQARQRVGGAGIELPTLAELREMETFSLPAPAKEAVLLEDFRADPDANPLSTPSGKIEIFSGDIAGFGYDDCPGHPVWIEPYEWLGGDTSRYPLHLISNQPRTRLHSQFDPGSVSQASKVAGREPLTMNREDAAERGIADGDVVRVFNDRGACLAGAILSDDVRRGVAQLSTGAWYDPDGPGGLCKHGNPNVLTRDTGTSRLGQGPSAHTNLVEIEKFEGEPPAVTAFVPPAFQPKSGAS